MANPSAKDHIALIGGGKIGKLAAHLLARRYPVTVYDVSLERARESAEGTGAQFAALDAANEGQLAEALRGKALVASAAPYFCNQGIARAARELGLHYVDLTEDVETGIEIERIAAGAERCFIPHCGLAPGFIQIVAAHLAKAYENVERVAMRVGALPENPTNALKYNLTWSTDGLINEYGNPCEAVVDGALEKVQPLEGYERLGIEGVEYEAFNTSGGLGTLARTMAGKVRELNYKTIRYVGHRDLMKFLMFDLHLNEYREILKRILESAVPSTEQDRVVILVSVVGRRSGILRQQTYTRIVSHGEIAGRHWTGIQVTTASALAAVVDLVLSGKIGRRGFVRQEDIDLDAFLATEYGEVYRA
jgi:saccharopine dehydrogenase-like NADP-dependent oxidoreductase